MKKNDPGTPSENTENRRTEGMESDNRPRRSFETNAGGDKRFEKDKRKRITKIERNPRPGFDADKDNRSGERRSYNPNFTRDNKLRGEDFRGSKESHNRYGRKEEGDKQERRDFRKKDDNFRDKREQGGYRGSKFGGRNRTESNRYVKKPREFNRDRDDQGYTGGEYPKFPAPEFETPVRLNRYLAMSGVGSRRDADELIQSGQVTVNGVVITELGTKVTPSDVVKFNENVIRGEHKVYILMNKPKGYVTSLEDPHADKTVMELLKDMVSERVYPVGRLDKNSVGVLLITNDGDMTKRLTHPSYNKKKIYQVSLDKPLTKADMDQIATGVTLEDGEIHADEISYVKDNKREIGIEIHSGRNRIVRRIFEHLGYKVTKLDRVYFAGLTKKNLRRGAWRFLTHQEVQVLQSGMHE